MSAGGSAHSRAAELRAQAAQARARADALEAQAGAWSAGADGERRVAASLGRLPSGWHVQHDRLLRPGRSQTNLDHVVIGPSGVYLVDTKNWAGGTSVHDGNLWQHTSSSSPKGRELDNVSRFAAEMEKGLGLPVVPVIALAGGQSASFSRQRVRGVEIIPQDELVDWLLAQPAAPAEVGTELLSRRVAHAYPPASPDETGGGAANALTVADVVGAETPLTQGRPPVSTRRIGGAPDRQPVPQRRQRQRRRRGSTVSAFVGLVALFALSQLGPRIVPMVLGPSPTGVSAGVPGSLAPSPDPRQCQSLTKAMVQKITGARTVVEKPQSGDDRCTWWLAKPRYSTQAADLTVETGTFARLRFASANTHESRIDLVPGEASAWVPENTSLNGWKTRTRARQPFMLSLRFTYPEGASDQQRLVVEAAAERKVIRLAEALAIALAT